MRGIVHTVRLHSTTGFYGSGDWNDVKESVQSFPAERESVVRSL